MKNSKSMGVRSRVDSLGYAVSGFLKLLRQEPNMKLHMIAAIVVIAAGIINNLNVAKWIALIFAIALVWITEAFNTVLEMLCDLVTGKAYHPAVEIIKDISAAAVLIAALASIGVGLFVFFG